MIRGFFFDLDGTLVNTHQANFEAYRRALKEVSGVEITFDDFKRSIGHVAATFLPWYAPGLGEKGYKRITELKAEYYKDLMHLTELNVKLIEFMDLISEGQIVLVTTAKRRNAEAVLTHHKLNKYFHYIITAENVERSKPAPDAYELALQKTGLKPNEVIAFEDSESGRQAAESANIPVVVIKSFAV